MKLADLSAMQDALVSVFLIIGAVITFIGSLGLIRLRRSFYDRVHAPTLGTTLGTACIAAASMSYFTVVNDRLSVHELLIVIFITVTTPVSLMVLVKAAKLRETSKPKEREN